MKNNFNQNEINNLLIKFEKQYTHIIHSITPIKQLELCKKIYFLNKENVEKADLCLKILEKMQLVHEYLKSNLFKDSFFDMKIISNTYKDTAIITKLYLIGSYLVRVIAYYVYIGFILKETVLHFLDEYNDLVNFFLTTELTSAESIA